MNNTLGKYVPGNSFIHRLDPRFKILMMIILMVALFWKSSGFIGLFFVAFFIILALINAKIRFTRILRMMRYMALMLIILLVVNLFTIRTGPIIFNLNQIVPVWNFAIHLDPLLETAYIFLRLTFMISLSFILTSTTKPMELTYAIESLIKPLKVIKFPVHEVAMIISIALRFIPTLFEEAERIMKAQASRGVDMKEGKLKEKIRALTSLMIPLFVSAFQRSEELADAMEARNYDPNGIRTRYRILRCSLSDYLTLTLTVIILTATILIGIYQNILLEVITIW